MSRKTGAILVVALALSVAFLGVLLALRCQRSEPAEHPQIVPRTLTVGVDLD